MSKTENSKTENSIIDSILKEVRKWAKDKGKSYSKNAKNNCEHYLYTEPDPNPKDYGEWMRKKWNEAPWKNSLESLYNVELCGIHYESNYFEELVVLAPISTPEMEANLQAYSETFQRLSPYKSHFAYIMKENGINVPCQFRFGQKGNNVCCISDKLLDFFIENFKVCHLSVSLKNIQKNKVSVESELNQLKKDLGNMGLLENKKGDNYLKSIVISFYTMLTVLKEFGKKAVFNQNKSADAIFVPINLGGNIAVVPSLHSRLIKMEEIVFLTQIYNEIFTLFILWEASVSSMDEVKSKLPQKSTDLSKVLKNLNKSLSMNRLDAVKGVISGAIELLERHKKNIGGI